MRDMRSVATRAFAQVGGKRTWKPSRRDSVATRAFAQVGGSCNRTVDRYQRTGQFIL